MPTPVARPHPLPQGALALLSILAAVFALSGLPEPEQPAPSEPIPNREAVPLRDGRPIDLNHAGTEALQLLPGVGPAIAERIIAARPFSDVDALLRVSGIGPRRLQALRGLVTVRDDARTSPASAVGGPSQ